MKTVLSEAKPSCRQLKTEVLELLAAPDWESRLAELAGCPARQVVNPLFTSLCSSDPLIRWHGITAFGEIAVHLPLEDARIILRRLMWTLNDESGGIGWGAPEAMAEIMARRSDLAGEYHRILLSYIHEEESGEDNYLELAPLRRGAVWGIFRLAGVHPELITPGVENLLLCLEDDDSGIRGMSGLALGRIGAGEAREPLEKLIDDASPYEMYRDRKLTKQTVAEAAGEALALLSE
ncbi:MAG: DVU0298 family protein [Desulfovibrionales bacterium]